MMDDEGEARVKAAYSGNYDRHASLKKKYDPGEPVPCEPEHPPGGLTWASHPRVAVEACRPRGPVFPGLFRVQELPSFLGPIQNRHGRERKASHHMNSVQALRAPLKSAPALRRAKRPRNPGTDVLMTTISDVRPTWSNAKISGQFVNGRMLCLASSQDGSIVFAGSLSSNLCGLAGFQPHVEPNHLAAAAGRSVRRPGRHGRLLRNRRRRRPARRRMVRRSRSPLDGRPDRERARRHCGLRRHRGLDRAERRSGGLEPPQVGSDHGRQGLAAEPRSRAVRSAVSRE